MEWIFFDEVEVPSRVEGPSEIIDREEMVEFARPGTPCQFISTRSLRVLTGV